MSLHTIRPLQASWKLALLAVLVSLATSISRADIISFDPDGTGGASGSAPVATFDFLPGNSVFKNLGSITTPKVNQPITHYIQTRLGSLLGSTGNLINAPGLNSNYELTVAIGFDALANVAPVPLTTNFGTSYVLAPNPAVAFLKIYYDNNPLTQANDLTGTGFDDGHLILSGTITAANGSFAQFGVSPFPNLDSFGANNYPGVQTIRVAGGASLDVSVNSYDTDFFTGIASVLTVELFNQSDITPFRQVNPSATFLPNLAGFTPALGPLNGAGVDFQVQSDPNSSFQSRLVPEPSSVALCGLGLVAMIGMIARRRPR